MAQIGLKMGHLFNFKYFMHGMDGCGPHTDYDPLKRGYLLLEIILYRKSFIERFVLLQRIIYQFIMQINIILILITIYFVIR